MSPCLLFLSYMFIVTAVCVSVNEPHLCFLEQSQPSDSAGSSNLGIRAFFSITIVLLHLAKAFSTS